MFGIIAIVIAMGATAVAYITRRATIGAVASVGWLLLSFYAYQSSLTTWDSFYILFFVSILIAVAIFLEVPYMRFGADRSYREKSETQEQPEKKEITENSVSYEHPMDSKRRKLGLKPIHRDAEERRKWRGL